MKVKLMAGIALAVILSAGASALAKPLPAQGLSRQDIVNWLHAHGYNAQIAHDSVANEDYVSSSSNGVKWGFWMYGCDAKGFCNSVQYSVSWGGGLDATKLNGWNRDKRFLRAYIGGENSVFAEYDIDLLPGGTWEQLDRSLDRWNSQMAVFKTYIGQ